MASLTALGVPSVLAHPPPRNLAARMLLDELMRDEASVHFRTLPDPIV
jgi:hypothetical protein